MIEPATQDRSEDVGRRLRLFLLVDGLLTGICLLTELICFRLGLPAKYYKPWFIGIKFNDFLSYMPRFQFLHGPRFFDFSLPWPFSYPAPGAFLYALFYSAGPKYALTVFLATSLVIFFGAALLLRGALVRRGLAVRWSYSKMAAGVLLAFPFWFCEQRGNLEIIVWLFVVLGVWALTQNRGYGAATCFGLAASLKLVPFVYLALLVPRRQYKQLSLGLAVFAGALVAGYAFIGPTIPIAYHGIQAGLAAFNAEFLSRVLYLAAGFDHTVVGAYRRMFGITSSFAALLHWYTVTVAIAGPLLWLLHIRRLPFLNQLLSLTIAAVWLVPVSFEYTLMHLYAGVACVLLARLAEPNLRPDLERRLMPVLVLLAALCAPLTELVYHGWTYAGQAQSCLLLVLFVYVLTYRLPSNFDSAGVAQAG